MKCLLNIGQLVRYKSTHYKSNFEHGYYHGIGIITSSSLKGCKVFWSALPFKNLELSWIDSDSIISLQYLEHVK